MAFSLKIVNIILLALSSVLYISLVEASGRHDEELGSCFSDGNSGPDFDCDDIARQESNGFLDCHWHDNGDSVGIIWCSYKCDDEPFFCESDAEPYASHANEGGNCNNTDAPINIATGNKYFRRVDYMGGQSAHPLMFQFYFNSYDVHTTWTTSYRQSLIISPQKVYAKRADGQRLRFAIEGGVILAESQRAERLSLQNNRYELLLSDNTVERYNSSGQLIAIQYSNSISHQISYIGNTIVITRVDDSLTLTLNDGRVVAARLPDGTSITYAYDSVDGVDRLLTVTYEDEKSLSYLYQDTQFPMYVTGIIDENGNRISSVQYDNKGRAISSELGPLNSGIGRTQIQYNTDGTRTLTNALGKQSTHHFTQFNGEYKMTQVEGHASANCAAANQAYTYDANGFMASKTDWQGNVTTYVHNDRGQETSRTEASGTPQARTITTDWHVDFNLPVKITEPQRETVMSYDANGRLLSRNVQGIGE